MTGRATGTLTNSLMSEEENTPLRSSEQFAEMEHGNTSKTHKSISLRPILGLSEFYTNVAIRNYALDWCIWLPSNLISAMHDVAREIGGCPGAVLAVIEPRLLAAAVHRLLSKLDTTQTVSISAKPETGACFPPTPPVSPRPTTSPSLPIARDEDRNR
ncbi:hypothetical protein C0Q70_14014 [Pomacea canaliculata]|uniref:Uncharacterized protein n=1 Tax=Pomacea canaliculata TaxID=400727 RepID=A0A2T7NYY5_POMCA|nr:hypothetical protein C0Q70_14014 [Pomacea canaliculata]